jgi:hypothetical protein
VPTTRTAAEGDCISSIAAGARFRRHQTVYDHGDNAELKKKRPDPSQLHPGDKVVVPDFETEKEPAPTGQRTRFVVEAERTFVKLRVRYREKLKFRLETDKDKKEGETDGSGLIEAEVARDAKEATLTLWGASQASHPDDGGPSVRYTVELGFLAPLDTLRGVQGRLRNLGFFSGSLTRSLDGRSSDGEPDAATKAAIQAFQKAEGLQPTGKPADVRAALARVHDG